MTTANTDSANTQSRGAALMVSYEELVRIRSYMSSIDAKLDAALTLQGKVERLDQRVSKLETQDAYLAGRSSSWKSLLVYLGGIVTAAAGGALALFLH